jgi:hypothetical protein
MVQGQLLFRNSWGKFLVVEQQFRKYIKFISIHAFSKLLVRINEYGEVHLFD